MWTIKMIKLQIAIVEEHYRVRLKVISIFLQTDLTYFHHKDLKRGQTTQTRVKTQVCYSHILGKEMYTETVGHHKHNRERERERRISEKTGWKGEERWKEREANRLGPQGNKQTEV